MMAAQCGQTMPEYLVVATALVGAFFWTNNTQCPDYDNCMAQLAFAIDNRYDGFSRSISAVQLYGDAPAASHPPRPINDQIGNSDGAGTSVPSPTVEDLLALSTQASTVNPVTGDAIGRIETGAGGVERVIANDNSEQGYLLPSDGSNPTVRILVRPDGTQVEVGVADVVDSGGNAARVHAIRERSRGNDCRGDVLGFARKNSTFLTFHDPLSYQPIAIGTRCAETTYQTIESNGVIGLGVVTLDGKYFNPPLAFQPDNPIQSTETGEAYWVELTVPNPPGIDPRYAGLTGGQVIQDCVVISAESRSAVNSVDPFELYRGLLITTDPDAPPPSVSARVALSTVTRDSCPGNRTLSN
ncbi:hypothetical protein [Litorivicinus lipolyticus]|uniref:hypothetical protein n=1 Tax=Litorivicinus lipolyticus TaxID=418701 RepID=UPI003B5B5D15